MTPSVPESRGGGRARVCGCVDVWVCGPRVRWGTLEPDVAWEMKVARVMMHACMGAQLDVHVSVAWWTTAVVVDGGG